MNTKKNFRIYSENVFPLLWMLNFVCALLHVILSQAFIISKHTVTGTLIVNYRVALRDGNFSFEWCNCLCYQRIALTKWAKNNKRTWKQRKWRNSSQIHFHHHYVSLQRIYTTVTQPRARQLNEMRWWKKWENVSIAIAIVDETKRKEAAPRTHCVCFV